MSLKGQHCGCSVQLPNIKLTRARQGCFEVHFSPMMPEALPHLAGHSSLPQLCRVHCISSAVMPSKPVTVCTA